MAGNTNNYKVTVYTSEIDNGGTDEQVFIILKGPQGSLEIDITEAPPGAFEQATISEISFAASVISPITDVGFHQEKRTIDGNSKWHPEWVEVENTTTGYKTRWRCEFGYIDNGQIKFCKKKEF